jgi:hypothetical protein
VAHACRCSDDTSRRLRDALEDRARDGRPHMPGKRAYGYARDAVTIIEDEAALIREVYARCLEGASPGEIARELNERGKLTGQWEAVAALRGALGAGLPAPDRDPGVPGQDAGEGDWPAIIDRGMWTEVQERRRTAPRRMTGAGGGFICCGNWWCARNAAGGWPDPPVKTRATCVLSTPTSCRRHVKTGSGPLPVTLALGWRDLNPRPLRPELRAGRSMVVIFAGRRPVAGVVGRCWSAALLYCAAVQLRWPHGGWDWPWNQGN